jgi:hypothetical protein
VFRQKPLHIAPAEQQYGLIILIILLLTETERHLSDILEQWHEWDHQALRGLTWSSDLLNLCG